VLFVLALSFASSAAAQSAPSSPESTKPAPTRRIVVSIPDRQLALLEDGRLVKLYFVAVGAPESPSPSGEYQIVQRLENPGYYKPGVVVAPGAGNPLGTRWMGLSVKGFGIHGTNRPASIGKNASHGCIRLRNRDIEDLFARVSVGDRVTLLTERSEEFAQIFGAPANAPATQVARNDQPEFSASEERGD
jgi:lipoprotein-anchoring transpeptidase ErfK/SrfK